MTDPRNEAFEQVTWERRLDKTDSGRIRTTLNNCYLLAKNDEALTGAIKLNEFSLKVERAKQTPWGAEPGAWADDDDSRLRVYLTDCYQVDFPHDVVQKTIGLIANDNKYHPVRDYLEGLEPPSGEPIINSWLRNWIVSDSPREDQNRYVDLVGVFFLVAAVARIYQPGCKLDNVLILEGEQGLGKSSLLGVLGGEWFSDTSFVIGDKDAYQVLRGVWLYEMAELDALNKTEATRYKAFISSPVDRYRPSYGHHVLDVPRQCVFAGTTNQHEYLRDPTGNRRFWPVLCQPFSVDEFAQYRDQLWSEAFKLYRDGQEWWPSRDEMPLFGAQQSYREIADPWETLLHSWLDDQLMEEFSTAKLLQDALKIDPGRIDERAMAMRVSKVMRRLGWTKRQASTVVERQRARYMWVRPKAETGQSGVES